MRGVVDLLGSFSLVVAIFLSKLGGICVSISFIFPLPSAVGVERVFWNFHACPSDSLNVVPKDMAYVTIQGPELVQCRSQGGGGSH